ncbi:hypothetical protein [Pseudonocardia sp. TRM90224]|uniref:hypothetical protein n=1 Tax=Pseudonocardia sp. TRM90224 TaxID=2812678 RepID=UPI001E453B2F|nr:hypothetical protein [Pseudonocardia sp. TRM90224]
MPEVPEEPVEPEVPAGCGCPTTVVQAVAAINTNIPTNANPARHRARAFPNSTIMPYSPLIDMRFPH